MPYKKVDQKKFLINLSSDEFVVKLNTGQLVAVSAVTTVESNTGNVAIEASARQVKTDGSPYLDNNGQEVKILPYSFSADKANLKNMGGIEGFKKLMLLTVLGEKAEWPHALPADVLDHASIRTNIMAASHSGPLSNIHTLL